MDSLDASTVEEFSPLQQLVAKHFGAPGPAVAVDVGGLSHRGYVRAQNEDHFIITRWRRSRDVLLTNLPPDLLRAPDDTAYVLTVADGVAGAASGEVASALLLQLGWDLTTNVVNWQFRFTDAQMAELREKYWLYGQLIHRAIRERALADERLRGMATTATSVLCSGLHAVVGHIGDSRAYLYRAGKLQRLTSDHTLAQQFVDEGLIASVEQAPRVLRNVLLNCLGGDYPDVKVDTYGLQLADLDRLLLCTDGLTDMVDEAAIGGILALHAESQTAASALVDRALENGGRDNITVVVAAFATERV